MSIRFAILASAASSLVLSAPATANERHAIDDRYASSSQYGTYEGEWDGAWESEDRYDGLWTGSYTDLDGRTVEAEYDGTFVGDARFLSENGPALYRDGASGWYEDSSDEGGHPYTHERHRRYEAPRGPRLAYSLAERDEWLAQCRALRNEGRGYYIAEDNRNDGDSDIVGGILGAIVGGIAGNRIADGDRLAGTLIGAGVGGLAGAVIGSAISGSGRDDDDYGYGYGYEGVYADDEYAIDYCEAYLINYERGYGTPQMASIAYAPVMMAPAPLRYDQLHRAERYKWIEEEVIVDEAPRHPPHRIRRTVAPRPDGKLQPSS